MGKAADKLLPKGAIYATFHEAESPGHLPKLCMGLLAEQKRKWPLCERGYASLGHLLERRLRCGDFSVLVQHNPGRIKSTLADVGEKGVRERSCFLCPGNLPEGQKAIVYRNDYLILCNPMPVFSSHFTISHLGHVPQAIDGAFSTLLRLTADLGPSFSLLYNGPRCGASAPDHLHFQAVPSGRMPIEKEVDREQPVFERGPEGVSVGRMKGVGREVVVFRGSDLGAIGEAFHAFVAALGRVAPAAGEPMMSLICIGEHEACTVLLFPRAAHRPRAFYSEGEDRLVISPAAVEMGGIMVAPFRKDFDRFDRTLAEGVFREVSLDAQTVGRALAAMKRRDFSA